jgi:hypothetical protein
MGITGEQTVSLLSYVYHNHKVYHHSLVLFIASVFFCTYNTIKKMFSKQVDPVYLPVIHMGAACAGEIVSHFRVTLWPLRLDQKRLEIAVCLNCICAKFNYAYGTINCSIKTI